MTGTQLRDFIPLMPIASPDDHCLATRRGDVAFGWKVVLPVAGTVSEGGYDSMSASLAQALRLLPDWCVVHKQDVYFLDRCHGGGHGEFLMDSYERFHDGRPFLQDCCFLFLVFSSKAVVEASTSAPGRFSLLKPVIPSASRVAHCASVASQFASVLGSNPLLELVPLTGHDYLHEGPGGYDEGLLADALRLWRRGGPDYDLHMTGPRIRVGDEVAAVWYVEDSDAFPPQVSSVVSVDGAGGDVSFLSGGSPVGCSLRIPHAVNRYIFTYPKAQLAADIDRRRRLGVSFSAYSQRSRVDAEELEAYQEAVARDGLRTVRCFMDLVAWCPERDLPRVRDAVVTAFSDMSVAVTEERRFAPHLFMASLPGAAAGLGSDYHMTSELTAFLCLGLWDGHDGGIPGGVVRLSDRRRLVPVTLDMQVAARDLGLITNLNILVVGPTGSGKSFTMNHLVNCFYAAGQHGLIIDIGRSYEGLLSVVREETGGRDGTFVDCDPAHLLSFNPFRGWRRWGDVDADGDAAGAGMDFLLSLLQTMYEPDGGWGKDATAVLETVVSRFLSVWDGGWEVSLEDSLRTAHVNARRVRARRDGAMASFDAAAAAAAWENPLPRIFPEGREGTDPVFDDFYRFVAGVASPLLRDGSLAVDGNPVDASVLDAGRLCLAMSKYAEGGRYARLLNSRETADPFASALTCYEVDRIKDDPDLFPLWLLSIMHSFEDKMRSLECPKFIVIEEAWSAVAKPSMARFIVWLWRTARKFRTSAIVVTQDAADLTASPVIRDAIVVNTATRILLDQSQNAGRLEATASLLSLTPMDMALVRSLNRHTVPGRRYKEAFVAVGSSYSGAFAVEVSPEQALAYESDRTRKAPLLRLAAERGSIIGAIRETVARQEKEK